MSQHDMNLIIHAAVRRDLARMEAALRSFPDGERGRARQLQRAWAELWDHLHRHHDGEDRLVWPWARGLGDLDPALIDAMESEHQAMAAAMESVTSAVDALAADPTSAAAATAADRVATAREVTEAHLVHEEQDVMPIAARHFESEEWKVVQRELRRSGGPTYAGRFFAWLQDGADPEVLGQLRSTVPPPVLFVFSRVLGRAYHREVAPVWR